MNKKIASLIGIGLGIAMLIVGFCVQGINVDSGSYSDSYSATVGSNIKFGADFYTEIYDVTKDVGEAVNAANKNIRGAVNNAQRNICNAIESICDAIGWLIVVIGLFDIAYFGYKFVPCIEAPVAAAQDTPEKKADTPFAQATPVQEPIIPNAEKDENN